MLRGKTIGVIGVGNMGKALARGLIHAGVIPADHLLLADREPERLTALVQELGAVSSSVDSLVPKSDIVILAVKPQDMDNLLRSHAALFRSDQLVISIAAGLRTQRLEQILQKSVPVVRVMPNLPVLVCAGASAYSLGQYASWPHGVVTSLIFSAVGVVVEVDEDQMDTVTALSGTGPAYVFLLAEMMTEAGTREGLPTEVSSYLAVQTILGAARMMKESDKDAAELRIQVTSPKGTTAAAVATLEQQNFRNIFYQGVHAARVRSAELSQD